MGLARWWRRYFRASSWEKAGPTNPEKDRFRLPTVPSLVLWTSGVWKMKPIDSGTYQRMLHVRTCRRWCWMNQMERSRRGNLVVSSNRPARLCLTMAAMGGCSRSRLLFSTMAASNSVFRHERGSSSSQPEARAQGYLDAIVLNS